MNKRQIIASILNDLNILDQQKQYKIADLIFNNLRTAQQITLKKYKDLMEELRTFAVSKDALKSGYRSLTLKYHPDLNNGSKIAEKNFILLGQVYGRLMSELSQSEKKSNQFISTEPISDLYAEVVVEYTDDPDDDYNTDGESYDLDEEEIIKTYKDFLIWSKYYTSSTKLNHTQPVRISFNQSDIEDIIKALMQFGTEKFEFVTNVEVKLYYTDSNGIGHQIKDDLGYEYSRLEIPLPAANNTRELS
jgi:hypothetical protein